MDYKKIGFGLGAFAVGAVAWTAGFAVLGPRIDLRRRNGDGTTDPLAVPVGVAETEKHFRERAGNLAAEHVPTDLMGDTHPGADARADVAFRPDPTAVPSEEEREALRPATGPAPTLVADRGSGFGQTAGAA